MTDDYVNPHGGVATPHPQKSLASQYKKRAYHQEVATANEQAAAGMPSNRVTRSGAVKNAGLDGDTTAEWYLGECKNYTPRLVKGEKFISFPISWLEKAMAEGKISGKPGIVFLQPKGSRNPLVVVDQHQFIALMGRAYKAIHGKDYK